MAKIEIQSAFVEKWNKNQEQHPAWGMKTAEPHSRKDEQGNWQTVSRSFRTVKVSRESGIDLTQFPVGSRVQVWGKETTEVREHDGKKYYDVVVWADRVEVAQGSQQTSGGSTGSFGGGNSSTAGNASQTGGQEWANPGASFDDAEAPF